LLLHPSVQHRLIESPPVAELEAGQTVLAEIFVKSFFRNAQILGRFTGVHNLSEMGHESSPQQVIIFPKRRLFGLPGSKFNDFAQGQP
jgi:hypothetical protein